MNTKMRRSDRALSEMETQELLSTAEYGVLTLTDPEGMPYGVPLSFAMGEDCLYFHGAAEESKKTKLIEHCPKACFTVVCHTQVLPDQFSTLYRSAIVYGTVQRVKEDAEKRKGLEALICKYSPDYLEKGHAYIDRALDKVTVLKLNIEAVTGKGRKK